MSYMINGWHGKINMNAKELYERIMEDSNNSDIDWIAPATELIRICTKPDFPKEYAKDIYIRIFDCFGRYEREKDTFTNFLPTDNECVQKLYNDLACSKDEKIISARKRYFSAILDGIILYENDYCLRFPIHHGPKYRQVCENWKRTMMKMYFNDKPMDFEKTRESLERAFGWAVKAAEEQGFFKEEDEKNWSDFIRRNSIKVIGDQGVPTTDGDREER